MDFVWHRQCDQIGRLLKVLANEFCANVAQSFGDFWGYFKYHYYK